MAAISGIDWASEHHDVHVASTEGEVLERRRFAHDEEGVSALVELLVDRRVELGVIAGYTVRVDHSKLGRPLVAFTELRFTGSTPVEEITEIAAATPEVEALFTIAGDPDAIVQVRVSDVDRLNVVIDRFRRSGKVTGTKTLIVLGSWCRHGAQQLQAITD